jgi:hypothetical protein
MHTYIHTCVIYFSVVSTEYILLTYIHTSSVVSYFINTYIHTYIHTDIHTYIWLLM